MRQVNIYTATTFKGLNVQNGIMGYILELVTDTEPITLDSTELLYDMKPNRAELIAVIKALQRMKEKCELLAGHKYEFRLQEEHSYRNWLKGHIEKVKEYEDV